MSSIMRKLGIAIRGPDALVLPEPMFLLAGVLAFVHTKHILATSEAPTLRGMNREEPISATFSDKPVSHWQHRLDEGANFTDQKTHYQPALDGLQAKAACPSNAPARGEEDHQTGSLATEPFTGKRFPRRPRLTTVYHVD